MIHRNKCMVRVEITTTALLPPSAFLYPPIVGSRPQVGPRMERSSPSRLRLDVSLATTTVSRLASTHATSYRYTLSPMPHDDGKPLGSALYGRCLPFLGHIIMSMNSPKPRLCSLKILRVYSSIAAPHCRSILTFRSNFVFACDSASLFLLANRRRFSGRWGVCVCNA